MPNASLIELEGDDSFPWAGDQDAAIEEIQEFLTGERTATGIRSCPVDRHVHRHRRIHGEGGRDRRPCLARARREAQRHDPSTTRHYRGREIDTAGDGFLATFDGPARAVECARAISGAVRSLGISIRAGCHAGEVETGGGDVRGIAVHIGARIAALAGADEVLVSSTVRDLVAGSGLEFEDAGEHELKGVPDRWHLYRVVDLT